MQASCQYYGEISKEALMAILKVSPTCTFSLNTNLHQKAKWSITNYCTCFVSRGFGQLERLGTEYGST